MCRRLIVGTAGPWKYLHNKKKLFAPPCTSSDIFFDRARGGDVWRHRGKRRPKYLSNKRGIVIIPLLFYCTTPHTYIGEGEPGVGSVARRETHTVPTIQGERENLNSVEFTLLFPNFFFFFCLSNVFISHAFWSEKRCLIIWRVVVVVLISAPCVQKKIFSLFYFDSTFSQLELEKKKFSGSDQRAELEIFPCFYFNLSSLSFFFTLCDGIPKGAPTFSLVRQQVTLTSSTFVPTLALGRLRSAHTSLSRPLSRNFLLLFWGNNDDGPHSLLFFFFLIS